MPLNGSGTYSLATPEYPFIPDTYVLASDMNTVLEDIQTALNSAMYRDGQAVATANFNMAGYKITNLTNGSSAQDATTVLQVFTNPAFTASGAGITFTGTKVTYTLTTLDTTVSGTYTLNAGTLAADIDHITLTSNDIAITNATTFSLSSATSAAISSAGTLALTGTTALNIVGGVASFTLGATTATMFSAAFTATNALSFSAGTTLSLVSTGAMSFTGSSITLTGSTQVTLNALSTAVTQVPGTDNSTIATTAFVQQVALASTMPDTVAAVLFYNLNYI